MAATPLPALDQSPPWAVAHEEVVLRTCRAFEVVDLTARVVDAVRRAGLTDGLVHVQTRHTTTAVVLNEHEPLLFEDIEERLRRWASEHERYRHDDLRRRTVNVVAAERPNGHAHLRALVLGPSVCINVAGGALQLGRWQRVLFVELDGGQRRAVSVVAMGARGAGSGSRAAAAPAERSRALSEAGAARCG